MAPTPFPGHRDRADRGQVTKLVSDDNLERHCPIQGEPRTCAGVIAPKALAQSINVPKGNCCGQRSDGKLFGHLKKNFSRVRFLNTHALEAALHYYIHWYSTERIPTMPKGLSPAQHRAQALAAIGSYLATPIFGDRSASVRSVSCSPEPCPAMAGAAAVKLVVFIDAIHVRIRDGRSAATSPSTSSPASP